MHHQLTASRSVVSRSYPFFLLLLDRLASCTTAVRTKRAPLGLVPHPRVSCARTSKHPPCRTFPLTPSSGFWVTCYSEQRTKHRVCVHSCELTNKGTMPIPARGCVSPPPPNGPTPPIGGSRGGAFGGASSGAVALHHNPPLPASSRPAARSMSPTTITHTTTIVRPVAQGAAQPAPHVPPMPLPLPVGVSMSPLHHMYQPLRANTGAPLPPGSPTGRRSPASFGTAAGYGRAPSLHTDGAYAKSYAPLPLAPRPLTLQTPDPHVLRHPVPSHGRPYTSPRRHASASPPNPLDTYFTAPVSPLRVGSPVLSATDGWVSPSKRERLAELEGRQQAKIEEAQRLEAKVEGDRLAHRSQRRRRAETEAAASPARSELRTVDIDCSESTSPAPQQQQQQAAGGRGILSGVSCPVHPSLIVGWVVTLWMFILLLARDTRPTEGVATGMWWMAWCAMVVNLSISTYTAIRRWLRTLVQRRQAAEDTKSPARRRD